MFKYLDTSVENINRIKEARNNVNKIAVFSLIAYIICYSIACIFYLAGINVGSILIMTCGLIFILLSVGLIIKREIYSIMIFLRSNYENK